MGVHRSIMMLFLMLFALALAGQNRTIDSLLARLETIKEDTARVRALNELSRQFDRAGDHGSCLKYAQQALLLAEKLVTETGRKDLLKGKADALNNIGVANWRQGKLQEALTYYTSALRIREACGDKNGIAVSYYNIGLVHWTQGDYPNALKNYFNSLRIREETGDKKGVASVYNNIGLVYWNQGEHEQALNNYKLSLKIRLENGDEHGAATCYNNIGNIYETTGNYGEALKHYLASLEIRERIGDKRGAAGSYLCIGINHDDVAAQLISANGNSDSIAYRLKAALENYFVSLELYKVIKDNLGLAAVYSNIGKTYARQKKTADALAYLHRSLDLVRAAESLDYIKEAEGALSETYEQAGRYREALDHYKKYIQARDSIFSEENTRKSVQSQMQYEFEKQQAADSIRNAEMMKQEALKHDQEITQQRAYTIGGAIGFALMLVVAGVSFRAYRQKQRANRVISEQKLLVEEKQKEILDSIYYARRIQQSLLPTEKYIDKQLNRIK